MTEHILSQNAMAAQHGVPVRPTESWRFCYPDPAKRWPNLSNESISAGG